MVISLADTAHAALLPSQDEMRSFDQKAIDSGVAAEELMERAGEAIFREVKERFSFELYTNSKVVVLSGPGNNGGDGVVIARHLKDHGYDVVVVLASYSSYSEDLLRQIAKFREKEGIIYHYPSSGIEINGDKLSSINQEQLTELVKGSSVLIDALLGTGQKSAPRGVISDLLSTVNEVLSTLEQKPRIVAVDIPTGVNGDTGAVYANALNVDLTVGIELIKRGMIQYPARRSCGEIWCVSIGLECNNTIFSLIDTANLPRIPRRREESHKGNFGSVLVVGGSEDMPGAPILSARAALRLGAGSVYKAHLRGTAYVELPSELMLVHLGENDRHLNTKHLALLDHPLSLSQVAVLGPGIGTQPETKEFVQEFISMAMKYKKPLVIDADALNCLAQLRVSGSEIECPGAVLTPHPGEMARLLGISTAGVQADRYQAAHKLAIMTNATVVLKGASTIIATPEHGWVNTTGNPWLAVPGSGDVLAGIIAAFIGQGLSLNDATMRAVAIHGQAGDLLEQQGAIPCTANDIILAAATLAHN